MLENHKDMFLRHYLQYDVYIADYVTREVSWSLFRPESLIQKYFTGNININFHRLLSNLRINKIKLNNFPRKPQCLLLQLCIWRRQKFLELNYFIFYNWLDVFKTHKKIWHNETYVANFKKRVWNRGLGTWTVKM